jgi:hypothetical protein
MKNIFNANTLLIAGSVLISALLPVAAHAGSGLGNVPEPSSTASYAVGAIAIVSLIAFKIYRRSRANKN